ncbi:MAG: hypothetical protein WDZ84_10825 [Rhodovibrionaceae bacterium]
MNLQATLVTILISALAGAGIWLGIAVITDQPANWGNPAYVYFGLPLCALLCAALGFLEPERPWIWSVAMMASQAALLSLTVPPGNDALLLTALGTMAVLAVPTIAAAYAGRGMRAWIAAD